MIVTAFLNLIYFFIVSTVGILPSVDLLPTGFSTAMDSVLTIIAQWESVIPIFSDMLVIALLILSIETSILTLLGINWVIKKVTLSG